MKKPTKVVPGAVPNIHIRNPRSRDRTIGATILYAIANKAPAGAFADDPTPYQKPKPPKPSPLAQLNATTRYLYRLADVIALGINQDRRAAGLPEP